MSKALPDASVELNCFPSTILASAADMLTEATVNRAARATAATGLPACCSWRCAIARTGCLALLHLACRGAFSSGKGVSGTCPQFFCGQVQLTGWARAELRELSCAATILTEL